MATAVSSSSATKLTDLPLATLSRIAFLVGDIFVPHDITDQCNLPLIQPLRATCRLLREATGLAIGALWLNYSEDTGLRIKSTEDPQHGHSMTIPLDLVLSLPCLYELIVFGESLPQSFAKTLEVIPGLKRIDLTDTSENSTIRFRAFKSASTVETLCIWDFGKQAIKDLFSFRYDRLTDLTLGELEHVPVIPQRVLASIKSVSLSRPKCSDVDLRKFFESLTKGQTLQSLKIWNCTLEGMDLLHADVRFASLTKLSVSSISEFTWRSAEHPIWLTEALRKGRFPCLQELEFNLQGRYIGTSASYLPKFEPALAALEPTLRKLTLFTTMLLTEKDISLFRRLQSSRAFELHITMEYERNKNQITQQDTLSMRLFTDLSSLTSIGFCGYAIENVDELIPFPNLKEVSFTKCRFRENEALKLKNSRGSIEKITFSSCEALRENVVWDGTVTRR